MDHSVFIKKKGKKKDMLQEKYIIKKVWEILERGGWARESDNANLFQSNIMKIWKKSERELNQDYYIFYILNYVTIALK